MDYRDSEGYFQDDVLRVLGRPPPLSVSAVLPELTYRVGGSNFVDSEEDALESESEGSDITEVSMADGEWEEAKRVLYMSLVGVLLPMTFRYIGRRLTFTVWTKILTSYFRNH
ncbi:hypothetical protein IWW57_003524 [Coemansia sp. S610]|uniref:Uncharacterized protein n=1 Tax=Coemansia linderi TaxID=2663919 RepID=A0ACC1KCS4_9FUNG|nr:hypothetical protein IWW57_003524 [Coemansia sp. S610]KAJ2784347.1 hypothetical protein GGI18_003429 [Coemansia linderi]